MIRDTTHANPDIKSIILRYFNPIGAHPTALIGEFPNGIPSNLLPYITQTVAGIRKKLMVFGNDYNTPDGSCIRDYINVMDLARAHVVAVERILNGEVKQNEIYNLGTGKGLSVFELIDAFERANGVKVPYEVTERREGDIEQVWANPQKANRILQWQTEISVEETLRSAWKWQQHLLEKKEKSSKKKLSFRASGS
jgi:UDP-glucose 4-epimerase